MYICHWTTLAEVFPRLRVAGFETEMCHPWAFIVSSWDQQQDPCCASPTYSSHRDQLCYVVRVISCCKEAMTTHCFPLLLSSSFCPLLVFLFPISPAALSFRSGSTLSSWALAYRAEGSCGGMAACGTPAAPGSLTLRAEPALSDSSHSQLQLGLLAGVLGLGSSKASLPQDFYCHLFCCLWHWTTTLNSCLGIKAAQPRTEGDSEGLHVGNWEALIHPRGTCHSSLSLALMWDSFPPFTYFSPYTRFFCSSPSPPPVGFLCSCWLLFSVFSVAFFTFHSLFSIVLFIHIVPPFSFFLVLVSASLFVIPSPKWHLTSSSYQKIVLFASLHLFFFLLLDMPLKTSLLPWRALIKFANIFL